MHKASNRKAAKQEKRHMTRNQNDVQLIFLENHLEAKKTDVLASEKSLELKKTQYSSHH